MCVRDDEQSVERLTGQHFREGYNCAEAILRAFNTTFELGLSDDALRLAAGFGGGIGHAGCVCGALAASIMVLGALQGRTSKEESRDRMYCLSEGFHAKFMGHFWGTCCRVINPHPFDSREHLRGCLKITGQTAGLLQEYIRDNGIVRKNRKYPTLQG